MTRGTKKSTYSYQFNENDQEFSLVGSLRPQRIDELTECISSLESAISEVTGKFCLNVKRLIRMNNVAFQAIARRIVTTSNERPDLNIHIATSSVVGWSTRKFSALRKMAPNITINEYDNEFYPGQSFLEDEGFIPILRTQTKLTWHHEKSILPRHGLKPGMHVADICCGIGDFAVLLKKEFQPARLVALDHSKSSLAYARQVASDFGVRGIEYVYGDASEMLLDEEQFDFVTCRHSLQVFDRPDLILREIYRICKPGGRIYITNEKNSHCLGEPRSQTIQTTYDMVANLWAHFNMDIELGPKSRRYLFDAGFTDVRMESFMVTNLDGDPQDFADVIQSWEDVYAGQMAVERGDSPDEIATLRQGFQDHIFAALHPKGYAGWPIWVASGQKPL